MKRTEVTRDHSGFNLEGSSVTARTAGLLLLAGALTFYAFSVIFFAPEKTPFYDLIPDPDAPEYFAVAVSIAEGSGARIHLVGDLFPSRYPPGFSLVMAPFTGFGEDALDGPFLLNKTTGLLLLLWMFIWLWRKGYPLAAGLCTSLTVTLPGFIAVARSPMSELLSTLFLFVGVCLAWDAFRHARIGPGLFVSGLLVALSVSIRISNVFFLGATVLTVLFVPAPTASMRLRRCSLFGVGALFGLLPLWSHNLSTYGSPFANGYELWVPDRSTLFSSFRFEYFRENLIYIGRELLQQEVADTIASFYAEGSYFSLVLLTLAFISIWALKETPRLWTFLSCGVLSAVPFLFYFYQDGRFIFTQLLLLMPLLACASPRILLTNQKGSAVKFLFALLLVCQLADFPGTRFDPDFERHLRPSRKNGPAHSHKLVQELIPHLNGEQALVLTNINQPYVHALLNGEGIVAPLENRSHYSYNPAVFRFGKKERSELIARYLSADRPVFAIAREAIQPLETLAPPPAGHFWLILYEDPSVGRIAKLSVYETAR